MPGKHKSNIGLEGFATFKNTSNGWRVARVGTYNEKTGRHRHVICNLPQRQELTLAGEIVKDVRPGTFCKRPHHYFK